MRLQSALFRAVLAAVALGTGPAGATVLVSRFKSCRDNFKPVAPKEQLLEVNNVYVQIMNGDESRSLRLNGAGHDVLRLNLVGTTETEMLGYNATTGKLATLFTATTEAGVMQYTSTSYVCNSIFPSNLTTPYVPNNVTYCPLPAGDFALNVSVPLYNVHMLTTMHTRVHIVDTSGPAKTLACVDVHVTPYNAEDWPYKLFLWFPASLAIAYWIVTWAARFAAGWVIGVDRTDTRQATLLKWATMLISGLSGERLAVSTALLRFVTPGLRDIVHHIQFITMLGMTAVKWPSFFYPIVAPSAWADLLWNVTLVSDEHPTVYPGNYTAPQNFSFMFDDPRYPLYLNQSSYNPLLDLNATAPGMASFARVVGLRPQDMFGTCLTLFLALAGIIISFSLILWMLHGFAEVLSRNSPSTGPARTRPKSNPATTVSNNNTYNRHSYHSGSVGGHSRNGSGSKEWFDTHGSQDFGRMPLTPPARPLTANPVVPSKFRRIWTRFTPRGEAGAFHFSALYGNLLRLIITFHFPITAISVYHLTLKEASIVSRVFAVLALVFIAAVIPTFIMFKISRTPTGKLYDAARTLLSLGTVYNVYEQEKQLYRTLPLLSSLVSGVVIGAGQKSGLAQTILLVVVELFSFVATTFWSPWGQGASMSATVISLSIVRIASIVMAMILSPSIAVEEGAQQWLAYVVLIIQALVFIFFFFMILTKIVEGLIRLFGGAPFDESNHPIDGGIFAAIMDLDCLNGVRGGKAAARKRRKRDSRQLQRNVSVAGSLTTQMMLDRHSQGVERQLSSYPMLGGDKRGSYTPVNNPSMDRLGRQSLSDAGSMLSISDENPIMVPWRPNYHGPEGVMGSPTDTTGGRRFSSGYGGPSVRVMSGDDQIQRPQHSRARSSSAVLEELDSPTSGVNPPIRSMSTSPRMPQAGVPGFGSVYGSPQYPPMYSGGIRPDNSGLRPPPLLIAKRRSLNNISAEADEQMKRRGAAKRRSGGGWFGGRSEARDDSDSDDEPGPSRPRRRRVANPAPVEPYEDPITTSQPPRWRALFNRRAKPLDNRTRDENSARKAAIANESAAIFAGFDTPPPLEMPDSGTTSFRVQRKGRAQLPQGLAGSSSASTSANPSLNPSLNPSPNPNGTLNSMAPLLAPPTPHRFAVRRTDGRSGSSSSGSHGPHGTVSPITTPPLPSTTPPALEALPERDSEAEGDDFGGPSRPYRPPRHGHPASYGTGARRPSATASNSSDPSLDREPLDTGGYNSNLFVPLGATGRR